MSSSVPKTESNSLNYCISLLQRKAYEQYLATLLLPPKLQRCGFAIRAFNVEISSIRDQITSRNTGLGRTVFWQDLIQKLYTKGNIPNHPVARELQYVVEHVSAIPIYTQCGKMTNLLSLRFYVKSVWENVHGPPFKIPDPYYCLQ